MNITVAICTWNRAGLLDQTLIEMAKLRVPAGVEWELLVIDNNSTDDTQQVLARHANRLPLRWVIEPKQGHSHARNRAVEEAQGELIVWTDDDVLVDENWLADYVSAANAFPDAAYFGGPIDPWFEQPPPRWMVRHWARIRGVFVIRDYGPDVRPLQGHEAPAGANMAFRASVLKSTPFDTKYGRVGATLTGADDSEMIGRVRASGGSGVWVGTARVRHFLPADRLTKDFLARWYQGAGRTVYRRNVQRPVPSLWGVPRWAIWKYARARLRVMCHSAVGGEKWFLAYRELANLQGYLTEHREVAQREALRAPDSSVLEPAKV